MGSKSQHRVLNSTTKEVRGTRRTILVITLALMALLAAVTALTYCVNVDILPATPTASTRLVQDEAPPEVPYDAMHALYAVGQAAPMAFLMAFLTCLAGYGSKTKPEEFKLANFIYTALISLAIGTITTFAGLTTESAKAWITMWIANGFLTWYVWKVAKIIANWITKNGRFALPATGPPATA